MTGNLWEKTVYLGVINGVLAVWFCWKRPREAAYFGWALVMVMILAMGVRLHALGLQNRISIPLPYAVFDHLPFLKQARNPARIMAFGYAFLAVLVGLAAARILASTRTAGARTTASCFLFALVFADFFQTAHSSTRVEAPAYYDVIRKDAAASSGAFALMDIPWEQARFLMYQTIHEMPNAQGYIGHKSGISLIGRIPFDPQHLPIQQKLLAAGKIKYVVIHKKRITWNADNPADVKFFILMSRQAREYARFYPLVYEDDFAAVYRVYS